MKKFEAKKAVKGLFPSAEPAQVDLAAEMLDKIPPALAWAVLKTHRVSHEFLSFPMLGEAVRAAFVKSQTKSTYDRESAVAGIRRMARTEWGIAGYESMSDRKVIVTHFVSLIDSVTECPLALRLYVMQKCRQALQELGITKEESYKLACHACGIACDHLRQATDEVIQAEMGKLPLMSALLM